jgi:hypothetical protein
MPRPVGRYRHSILDPERLRDVAVETKAMRFEV